MVTSRFHVVMFAGRRFSSFSKRDCDHSGRDSSQLWRQEDTFLNRANCISIKFSFAIEFRGKSQMWPASCKANQTLFRITGQKRSLIRDQTAGDSVMNPSSYDGSYRIQPSGKPTDNDNISQLPSPNREEEQRWLIESINNESWLIPNIIKRPCQKKERHVTSITNFLQKRCVRVRVFEIRRTESET